MKKILVPTDFSTIADNALNYAIELAAAFKSQLYLCHVYNIHRKVDYNWKYGPDEQPYVKELEQKMNTTRLKFDEKIKLKGVQLHTILEEDSLFSLFKKKVVEHEIDLIVMGTKGASGFEKVIFGSVAATALEYANVPVLVIPPDHTFQSMKQVILATDLADSPTIIRSLLKKVATAFGAHLTVLHVNSNPNNDTQPADYLALTDIETTYREIALSGSINESINAFIDKNEFDLICMLRRRRNFFESILNKSITKAQVFNSSIPLLVLPE